MRSVLKAGLAALALVAVPFVAQAETWEGVPERGKASLSAPVVAW